MYVYCTVQILNAVLSTYYRSGVSCGAVLSQLDLPPLPPSPPVSLQLSLGTEDLNLLLEFALDTAQRVKAANLLPLKSKFT